MAEIIKAYRQNAPAMRFIGKKYGDNDRVNGNFGAKWGEWFENNWFDFLKKQINISVNEIYEHGDAYIGLMRWKEGEPFEYWIGMFMPDSAKVPEGFGFVDFPESKLGVCWIYGKESEVYCKDDICAAKLEEIGCRIIPDEKGVCWFFERYGCPRFTTPDEKGNIILDMCHYVE